MVKEITARGLDLKRMFQFSGAVRNDFHAHDTYGTSTIFYFTSMIISNCIKMNTMFLLVVHCMAQQYPLLGHIKMIALTHLCMIKMEQF